MTLKQIQPLLHTTEDGDCVTVQFNHRTTLTEVNVEEVGRQLNALVEGRENPHLTIDLANIDMLTSMALAKLITLNRRLRARGGRLTLVNPKPVVRQVFTVTQLTRILDVQDAPEMLSA